MKTEFINSLANEPVRYSTERIMTPHRLQASTETSEIDTISGREQERYRFELRLGAQFVNFPGPDWESSRQHQHRMLIRNVTEHIYHEVRHKLREMYPVVADLIDPEAREDLFMAIEELLDMTRPE